MYIKKIKLTDLGIFVLPTFIMVSQFFSFFNVRLSWIISLVLLYLVFLNVIPFLRNQRLLLMFIIIVFVPWLNVMFSYSPSYNVSLYISIITGFVYMSYICLLSKNKFDLFLKGTLASCVLFAVWGAFEIVTGRYFLFKVEIFIDRLNWVGNHYPGVVFANTNDLAQYLVLAFPIASIFLLKKHKISYVFFMSLIFFVIFNTGSKLSMISFVAIILGAYVLMLLFCKKRSALLKVIFIGTLGLGIVFGLEYYTHIVSKIIDNFLKVNVDADYYQGRLVIYIDLFRTALKLPLGGFGTAYVASEMPPHNFFLYLLCDYGWIPAILFICLLINIFMVFFSKAKKERGEITAVMLLSSLMLFPIMSCVSSSNEQRKVIWLMLGIYLRYMFLYEKENRNKSLN